MHIKINPHHDNPQHHIKTGRQDKPIKQSQNNQGRQRTNSCATKYVHGYQKKVSCNFTVGARVKPKAMHQYQNDKSAESINYSTFDEQTLVMQYPPNSSHGYYPTRNRKFNFDKVFIDKSNKTIYENFIKSKISILKQNMNLTILTYGITGSGKTYTIFGSKQQKQEGIAMLCFKDIIKQYKSDQHILLSFSYLQIYNQQVHDLLKPAHNQYLQDNNPPIKLKPLNVMEDSKGKVKIPDLSKIQISSPFQVQDLIQKGNLIRSCSSNLINSFSSRSHALLQLYCYNKKSGIQNVVTIIDLAGSERHISSTRQKSKEKQNQNLQKEGSNINRSLLALGNCLKGLQNNQPHIPYRDSKLTRILKQDLSGKAHNIMIACVGRNYSQSEETVNTLQYAEKAAKIQVQKIKNSSNNEKFQCPYCFRQTPWKQIIQKLPQKYSLSQNATDPKSLFKFNQAQKTNFGLRDPYFIQKCSLPQQFFYKNFKQKLDKLSKSIISLVNITFDQRQYEKILNLDCSSNCLFPSQNKNQYYNTERQNIQAQIIDLFNVYENQMIQALQMQRQKTMLRQNQLSNKQIVAKINRTVSQNIERQKNFSSKVQAEVQQFNLPNNTFSKTIDLISLDNNFNLQSFRQQTIGIHSEAGSDLRKKLSIKNCKNALNSANTTNATLQELNHINSSFESGKCNNIQLNKTQRMNPDTDEQFNLLQKATCKSAIIKKIQQAKKKYQNIDLQYVHQNCSRFEQDQDNQIQKKYKNLRIQIQKQRSLGYRQGYEKNEVYVSSFMEDSNQFDSIC